MGFAGRGMRKTRGNMNGLCREGNEKDRKLGMGMAEHRIGQPTPYRLNR